MATLLDKLEDLTSPKRIGHSTLNVWTSITDAEISTFKSDIREHKRQVVNMKHTGMPGSNAFLAFSFREL